MTMSKTDIAQATQKLQEAYADAPEVGRIGLEKMMMELKDAAADGGQRAVSAGRCVWLAGTQSATAERMRSQV